MTEMKTVRINEGTSLHCYTDKNFKTLRMSVNMLLPITAESAAKYGLLPSIVSRASREYPDYSAMGQRLAELYGAYIDSKVSNLGGFQVLSISVGGIAGRYAFDGENMEKELRSLLFSILFDPLRDSEGLLPVDGFEQEKRQVLEVFDSEYNDKIYYARRRALETLHGDAPAGINRYGKKQDVKKLSREEVSSAWNHLLKTAQFEIFTLGDCIPDVEAFQQVFQQYGVSYRNELKQAAVNQVKEKTELMQLAQSKLVLGYRAHMKPEQAYIFVLMCVIFGGTPSAKLFTNVREKMSLCYYCSASFDQIAAVMLVESGVETNNIEKAKQAIFEQLEEMKNGHISDEEIRHARLAILNSYRSITDSLTGIELWYLRQALNDKVDSPIEAAEKIERVTREEIITAANSLVLDTVYTLEGRMPVH